MPFSIPGDVRAVFFDAVGTILFPRPAAPVVYAEVARRAGVELSATARARFRDAYRAEEVADRASGWATSETRERDRWRTIVNATLLGVPDPDTCFRELFDHFATPAAWELAPGLPRLLESLRGRGLVLGIGSNYDARLLSVLAGFPELAPLRERVVVSAAVGFRKPAGEFFRELVRVAGCESGSILFVGDDLENDYHGATTAGLQAVLIDDRNRYPGVPHRVPHLGALASPG